MNNWIEVSADRLTANFRTIQRVVTEQGGPDTTILAVIKADAYGHGAITCAPILARAGARWLGVTCATEAVRIRQALASEGIPQDAQPEILLMSGFLPSDAPLIHVHALTPTLWTPEQINWLHPYPGTRVHVEVDTGMGRQGVTPAALPELLAQIHAAGLIPDGLFTHFCSSEVVGSPLTLLQQQRFTAVVTQAASIGLRPTWLHAANTSAIDNPVNPSWLQALAKKLDAKTLARPGLAIFGYTLPIESDATPTSGNSPSDGLASTSADSAFASEIGPGFSPDIPGQANSRALAPGTSTAPSSLTNLQPVLTWKAAVLATRALAPGETVGYNAIFTAPAPMRIALLPVGYADGLRRELSSSTEKPGGWVILHGHRAPILGRISMNLTVVDITHIPTPIHPGDHAILLGPGIDAHTHASLAHTIPYEILCAIHPCN